MKAAYTQEVLRRAQRLASLEKAGHALSTPDPRGSGAVCLPRPWPPPSRSIPRQRGLDACALNVYNHTIVRKRGRTPMSELEPVTPENSTQPAKRGRRKSPRKP